MQSDAYVSSGVILFPPPVKKAPAVSHSGAYVSSGVILLDSSEKPAQPKVRPDLLHKQARLQQAIAKACHKASRDVEVKLLSDKQLVVRVKARSAQEGQALSSLIFQMPELGPYQVSLDIPLH